MDTERTTGDYAAFFTRLRYVFGRFRQFFQRTTEELQDYARDYTSILHPERTTVVPKGLHLVTLFTMSQIRHLSSLFHNTHLCLHSHSSLIQKKSLNRSDTSLIFCTNYSTQLRIPTPASIYFFTTQAIFIQNCNNLPIRLRKLNVNVKVKIPKVVCVAHELLSLSFTFTT